MMQHVRHGILRIIDSRLVGPLVSIVSWEVPKPPVPDPFTFPPKQSKLHFPYSSFLVPIPFWPLAPPRRPQSPPSKHRWIP